MKEPRILFVALLLACGGGERESERSEAATSTSSTTSGSNDAPAPSSVDDRAVAGCATRFPATVPFDAGWPPTGNAMNSRPGDPPPVRTPDVVVTECEMQGGTNCDAGSFLSKEAASCVARAAAPEPAHEPDVGFGVPSWLAFNADTGRVEWSVRAAVCCGDAWFFRVDASSGATQLVSHMDPPQDCPALCAGTPIERPESP